MGAGRRRRRRAGHGPHDLTAGADRQLNLRRVGQAGGQQRGGRVGRARRDRDARPQPERLGGVRPQGAGRIARSDHWGEELGFHTDLGGHVVGPPVGGKVPQERRGGIRRIGRGRGGEPVANPVLGQQRPAGALVGPRLVPSDPAQQRPRHPGDDRVGKRRPAWLGEPPPGRGLPHRPGVGPQQGGSQRPSRRVGEHQAVHLAVDPNRGHVNASGPVVGGPDGRHDRPPPGRRVRLRPPGVRAVDRVAGLGLGQEAAVGAEQDRLGTTGAKVHAQERLPGHRTSLTVLPKAVLVARPG